MNRFDPPPDLGNANVGNIDKLLMRANPFAGLPVFLCDKPGKRLPCLHGQAFDDINSTVVNFLKKWYNKSLVLGKGS